MARSRYEYGTNPRKLQPERPKTQPKSKKVKVVKDLPKQDAKLLKAQKKKQIQLVFCVIGIFILLLLFY